MSRARQILPGAFYLLTRRVAQRQFLLHPDERTNEAFIYCLAEAAARYGMEVLMTVAESNHHHTVIYDRHGLAPEFARQFHSMVAHCQNARWGRWENLWSAEEMTLTRLLDRDAVVAKMVYAAGNPVKDGLVERAAQWPGVNGVRELATRRPLRAKRPRSYFRAQGSAMPAQASLSLTIPSELGDADVMIADVLAGVAEVERVQRAERATTGARVLGRRRVRQQSWRDAPTSREPRRTLRPRFAGAKAVRVPALLVYRAYLTTYRACRTRLLAGVAVEFPRGTYWLARYAGVVVVASGAPPCG